MDRPTFQVGRQGRPAIADLTEHVEQPAEERIADRHGDRPTRRLHCRASPKSRRWPQRDHAPRRLVEMALHLCDQGCRLIPLDAQGLFEARQRTGRRKPRRSPVRATRRHGHDRMTGISTWPSQRRPAQSASAMASGVLASTRTKSARLTMPTNFPVLNHRHTFNMVVHQQIGHLRYAGLRLTS